MVTDIILAGLALASIAITIWQWWAGCLFPMRKELPEAKSFSAMTLLKPLKGVDSATLECLESWFRQDYPGEFEILLGVASPDDPVCSVVAELLERHPGVPARLIICQPILGPNAKVSTLAHLIESARHPVIVVSDADVSSGTSFLRQLAAALADPRVGLVNAFYELANPRNLAMRLEALAVNADFWTQVLQGIQLKPMDFALGAVMAVRKDTLIHVGGFSALLEYLADDYQLGNRVAAQGWKIEILPVPVKCLSSEQSPKQVWDHQLRWARTIRVSRPGPWFLSILSNGTLWPVAATLAGVPFGKELLVAALAIRVGTATANYRRLVGQGLPVWAGFLAPVKDCLAVLVWGLSFLGSEITWRGTRYRVEKSGKLTPLA